jgi:hypothetical protein
MATSASVWLMTMYPPLRSQTFDLSALLISSVMLNCSNSGVSLL